mmetsp:Transcript_9698/g.27348  ORF Transcript_9698/g.27348 Transcript_9698/m.27348 type:complete len:205 (+) Transcript_9698:692-1306(+)
MDHVLCACTRTHDGERRHLHGGIAAQRLSMDVYPSENGRPQCVPLVRARRRLKQAKCCQHIPRSHLTVVLITSVKVYAIRLAEDGPNVVLGQAPGAEGALVARGRRRRIAVGTGLVQHHEQPKDVVHRLVVVAVLTHAQCPHLLHLMDGGSVGTRLEGPRCGQHLVDLGRKLPIGAMQRCQAWKVKGRKRVVPSRAFHIPIAPL